MKKLAKLALIMFVIAAVLTVVGGYMISGSNVNYGDVYELFTENMPIAESNVTFSKTPEIDLSNYPDMKESEYTTYQLNDFNSLAVYADKCTLEFIPTSTDKLIVSLIAPDEAEGHMVLQTAIKNGTLYVKFRWYGEPTASAEDTVLTIGIPDNYKGGFDINASDSNAVLCDLESSMNIRFNLYNCNMTAEHINGRDIVFESSGGVSKIEKITSSSGFNATCVSTDLDISSLYTVYTKIGANSAKLNFYDISGSFSSDLSMTDAYFEFSSLTGNISSYSELSRVSLIIPYDISVRLHHKESYASFKNNLEKAFTDSENENSFPIIDTNTKFGIVSLSEKV